MSIVLKAGHQIIDQHAVDPLALVRESVRDVERAVAGREQVLENKVNSVLPIIWVDVDMVHRVFINLLENATNYTPVGGHIEIGAKTTVEPPLSFWVRDNGPGISAADIDRVFDNLPACVNE